MYDSIVPSKAHLTLPDLLEIEKMADGTSVVCSKRFIEKGTKFGPYVAKKVKTLNPNIIFPIKIFVDNQEDTCEYYLETTNENDCNWMMLVTPAENVEDQNLICYQVKDKLNKVKKSIIYIFTYKNRSYIFDDTILLKVPIRGIV